MARVRGSSGGQLQRGFTLVEVMVVVALIGVLAAVVVPTYFRSSRKAKADSEVSAMFAELAVREEQYKQEVGSYLAAAACPSTTTPEGTDAETACLGAGTPWRLLRVSPPQRTLRCSYQVVTGTATTTASNPGGFTFTSPPTSWYYVLATCDTDGKTAKNSTFFISSVDSTIQSKDVGE